MKPIHLEQSFTERTQPVNAQSDPGVVFKSLSASQQSILSPYCSINYSLQKSEAFQSVPMSLLFCVILFYMIFLVSAAASVGTEQMSTGHLVPLYFPLSEFVNTDGTI